MTGSGGRVALADALDPLVVALDVGSTASRGDVYDASGRPVEGGRRKVAHSFRTAGDGTSEIDPDRVADEIGEIIDHLVGRRHQGRVGGVALDTFASSLVGVGADGRAVSPCYTYADSRCGPQVTALRGELDEAQVQQRTGCRLHSSYLPARLRWLRETDPERFAAARRWMSLGEYVYLRLLGTTAAGTAAGARARPPRRRARRRDSPRRRGGHGQGRVDRPARPPDRALGLPDAPRRRGRGRPAVGGARPGPPADRGRSRGGEAVAGPRRRPLVRTHRRRLRQQPGHRRLGR